MLKEIRNTRVFVPKRRPALYDKVEWFRKRDRIAERHLRKTRKRTKRKIFEFLKYVTKVSKFVEKSNKRLLSKAFDGLRVQFLGDNLQYLKAIQHENELLKIKSFIKLKQNLVIAQKEAYFANIQYKNKVKSFFKKIRAKKEEVYYPFKEFQRTLFVKALLLAVRNRKDTENKMNAVQSKKEKNLKHQVVNRLKALSKSDFTDKLTKQYFVSFFFRNTVKQILIREEKAVSQSFKEEKLKAKAFYSLLSSAKNKVNLRKMLVSYLKQSKISKIDKILQKYVNKKIFRNRQKARVTAEFFSKVKRKVEISKSIIKAKISLLKLFLTTFPSKYKSKMTLRNFFASKEARRRSLLSKINRETLEKAVIAFNSHLRGKQLKSAFKALKKKKNPNLLALKLFLRKTKTLISLKSKQKQLQSKAFHSLSPSTFSKLHHFFSCIRDPTILSLSKLSSPICKLLCLTLKTVHQDPKRTFFSLLKLLSIKNRFEEQTKIKYLALLNKAAQRQKRIKAKIQLEKAKIIKESFKTVC